MKKLFFKIVIRNESWNRTNDLQVVNLTSYQLLHFVEASFDVCIRVWITFFVETGDDESLYTANE